jgi:DNA mismatch endonuclease (patch repair protein)
METISLSGVKNRDIRHVYELIKSGSCYITHATVIDGKLRVISYKDEKQARMCGDNRDCLKVILSRKEMVRTKEHFKSCVTSTMKANTSKSKKEELLALTMTSCGITGFERNPKDIKGKPDFVFRKEKIVIFLHGCFWHMCQICTPRLPKSNIYFWNNKLTRNVQRDVDTEKYMISHGWTTYTIWEHDLATNLDSHIDYIKSLIVNISM